MREMAAVTTPYMNKINKDKKIYYNFPYDYFKMMVCIENIWREPVQSIGTLVEFEWVIFPNNYQTILVTNISIELSHYRVCASQATQK